MNKKEKSIKKNFIWNLIRSLMVVIFPLISFPYAARILGTDGIGKINYVSSINSYFVMFATLGIPTYAIREGAKIRDNKHNLGKFTTEVFIISIFSSLVSCVGYLFIIFNPKFADYKDVLSIFIFTIPFSALGISWLYQIVEDYKRITIQSILLQFISLILLFSLVKTKDDYMSYAFINIFSIVGANALYLTNSKKYVKLFGYEKYSIRKHIKPIFVIFFMSVASSIYLNFDVTMLGYMKDDSTVGLYTAAVKINRVVCSVIASLSSVVLARLSYYIKNSNMNSFDSLLYKTSSLINMISIPAAIGLFVLSKPLILLFSGAEFIDATIAMDILCVDIWLSPINGLIAYQILMPFNKEKYSLYATLVGCVVNLVLNVVMIPVYSQNGAAFTTVLAEFMVFLVLIYYSKKMINIKKLFDEFYKYVIASMSIFVVNYIVNLFVKNLIINVLLVTILGGATYFLLLIILKNKLIIEAMNILPFKRKNK